MLSRSDTDLDKFIPIFAEAGVNVAFLVPTETGYKKSIMDATAPVRELLRIEKIHDYDYQFQGQDNKVVVPACFVTYSDSIKTSASLYRPETKQGDPRIWFKDLRNYCRPYNLLALIVINKTIYVFNLSDPWVSDSVIDINGYARQIISEARFVKNSIAKELLDKIQEIHDRGYLRSITEGDPGVGDTLENALGIMRNNSINPDYKGIELKATRKTKQGRLRVRTRENLFSRVPDSGLSYRQIVEKYGKVQVPRGSAVARLQLYETCRVSRPNAYDLQLQVDNKHDELQIVHISESVTEFVSSWTINSLKDALMLKHRETFWVEADSIIKDDVEYFQYNRILHTKRPNTSLFIPLIEENKITVDLAAHIDPETNQWRDHGVLFKMLPDDLPLLLGEPEIYDLTHSSI